MLHLSGKSGAAPTTRVERVGADPHHLRYLQPRWREFELARPRILGPADRYRSALAMLRLRRGAAGLRRLLRPRQNDRVRRQHAKDRSQTIRS